MRGQLLLVSGLVLGCGGSQLQPKVGACTRAQGADPGACLAVAEHHLAGRRSDDARGFVERAVDALNADASCLRDHGPKGCFGTVLVLLREPAEGLLAPYAIAPELAALAPFWTASESTGPRAQARTALAAMCTAADAPPIERQRACLVLGDLVENERAKRCGVPCDPESDAAKALGGWSPAEVVDGHEAACKVDPGAADPAERAAFEDDVARTYRVSSAAPVCGVRTADRRGASIAGTLAIKARLREQAAQQAQSRTTAAEREARRMADIARQQEAATVAAQREAELAARTTFVTALGAGAFEQAQVLLERYPTLIGSPEVIAAIGQAWTPLVAAWTTQLGEVGVYFELHTRLGPLPAGHALAAPMQALARRALTIVKKDAKAARGVGSRWVYATLLARLAGPSTAELRAALVAQGKLLAVARATLAIDTLAPTCAPLVRSPLPPGRPVRAKATLTCAITPERRLPVDGAAPGSEATRRVFELVAHGTIAITRGAPARTVPIDIEVRVDDADGSDPRTFEVVRNAAVEMVWRSTIGQIETADAQTAYAAGLKALKARRADAALDQLVRHALIAGASPELDELLNKYGTSFSELVAITR